MGALPQVWSDDELIQLFERVNNAGRWGVDDELGTLNYITPEKRREAARLLHTGETLSLAHPLAARAAANAVAQVDHRMLYGHLPGRSAPLPASAGDYIGLDVHQPGLTHLDALSHVASHDGRVYNGRRFADVTTGAGLAYGSIDAQRQGIVSRGVLLDLPAALGLDWLESSHRISVGELEAAERHGAVRVSRGDVLIVRAGNQAREASAGPQPFSAGPGPDCIEWIHRREAAVYTGDAPEYITPAVASLFAQAPLPTRDPGDEAVILFPLPLHQIGLAAMGLVLLDHCRVEELARTCQQLGRYEFLFFAAPLPLPGATGSPVNPIAVF